MAEKTYTVAVLTAQPGKTNQLIRQLEELAKHTRQEDGCIEYGFYQDQRNTNTILSYEAWKDVAAETKHWKTPHLNQAIEAFKGILDGDPVVYKGPKII